MPKLTAVLFFALLTLIILSMSARSAGWFSEAAARPHVRRLQNPALYRAPTGFNPGSWGPGVWRFFHMATAVYPVQPTAQDKKAFRDLVAGLAGNLPCAACRDHFQRMVSSGSLALTNEVLESRMTLWAWGVDVHNRVNRRIGKPVLVNYDALYRELVGQ
jgi:hypothetical protein